MWIVCLQDMPTFPPELTDEIIAWIPAVCSPLFNISYERYRTLLNCSLVCSAWLPASRHQLFQDLHIDSSERYDLLVSRVLHSEKMRIHLLSVRAVRLSFALETPLGTPRPFVPQFAGHLPNVTDMTFLLGGGSVFSSHSTSGVAISRFSLVQSLSLRECTFPSFGAFRRTLTSLSSLNNLVLYRPSWPDRAVDFSAGLLHGASTVRRPALSVLDVSWGTGPPDRRRAQQFIDWLSKTATSSSLLDLRLKCEDPEPIRYVTNTLSRPYLPPSPPAEIIKCMATFGQSLRGFRGLRKLNVTLVEKDCDPGQSSYSSALWQSMMIS